VNAAGIIAGGSIENTTDEQWAKVMDINLHAPFRLMRAATAPLAESRGSIVNVSSVNGLRSFPNLLAYCVSKSALDHMTRCAALDVAQHGIRVNAVAPSLAIHPFLAKVTSEELLAELAAREAFGRAAHPSEVANVIAFLASDYASYLTGEVVSVSSQHP